MNKAQIEEKIRLTIERVEEAAMCLADSKDELDLMTILCSCDDLHDLANKLDDLVTKYEDAEE